MKWREKPKGYLSPAKYMEITAYLGKDQSWYGRQQLAIIRYFYETGAAMRIAIAARGLPPVGDIYLSCHAGTRKLLIGLQEELFGAYDPGRYLLWSKPNKHQQPCKATAQSLWKATKAVSVKLMKAGIIDYELSPYYLKRSALIKVRKKPFWLALILLRQMGYKNFAAAEIAINKALND